MPAGFLRHVVKWSSLFTTARPALGKVSGGLRMLMRARFLFGGLALALVAACGEDVTQVSHTGGGAAPSMVGSGPSTTTMTGPTGAAGDSSTSSSGSGGGTGSAGAGQGGTGGQDTSGTAGTGRSDESDGGAPRLSECQCCTPPARRGH